MVDGRQERTLYDSEIKVSRWAVNLHLDIPGVVSDPRSARGRYFPNAKDARSLVHTAALKFYGGNTSRIVGIAKAMKDVHIAQ